MLTLTINGTEYELAATLRVAYKAQGEHNHKSYMEVFQSIPEMTIEQQIKIIYLAFAIRNVEEARTDMKWANFLDYMLDNSTAGAVLELLNDITGKILGEDFIERAKEQEAAKNEGDEEGN